MSLWIKSHQDVSSHPKIRKAARRLGINVPQMVGHMHMFWHWCLSYAQVGDLTGVEAIDIAFAVMWEGDENTFINALIEFGLIDVDGDAMSVHDWSDYGGKLVEQRQIDASRKRKKRADKQTSNDQSNKPKMDVQQTSEGCPQNVREERREEKSTEEKKRLEAAYSQNGTAPEKNNFLHPERIPNIESKLAIELRRVCKKPITLSQNDRAKMLEALMILESQDATPEQMQSFGRKVQFHWCGKNRQTQKAAAPGIMQVAENWQDVLAIDETAMTQSAPVDLDAIRAKYPKEIQNV